MSLLPREHGAYGQIAFPLIAAFAVAGPSTAGTLIAVATVAGFLAHEPALILLGLRGVRAKRDMRPRAVQWLGIWAVIGAAAGIAAVMTMDRAARPTLLVPLVPALLLALATARGKEKSWCGETAAAVAFSAVALPVAVAAGAAWSTAAAIVIPFALLFVSSTLAVRVVILRVRGGGDPVAAAITRRAALSIAVGGAAVLAMATAIAALPVSTLGAAAPGLITAAALAVRPPGPSRLRAVGWTLVAVSVLTTALVIIMA